MLRLIKSLSKENHTINNYAKESITIERIGSCGEPLAHEVGKWAVEFFTPKIKSIVNTYFQTETGGILIAPKAEDGVPTNYSSVGKPGKDLEIIVAKDVLSVE